MYNQQRQHSSKTVKTEKPSRVLFICIYDPIVFQLTNDLVYNKFSQYGRVVKVLIFQRSQVTKLFVQFASMADSEQAKERLDGTMLHNSYCKMSIFYSNLKTIDLRNRNSQGKDYSTVRGEKMEEDNFDDIIKTERKTYDDLAVKNSFVQDFSIPRRCKTDTSNEQAIMQFRNISSKEQKQIDEQIIKDALKIVSEERPSENQSETDFKKKKHLDIVSETPLMLPKQSEIIYFAVQGKIDLMSVYNLFSNYGNIQKIVYKLNTVYVQYANVEFAVIAKDYLQNMVLNDNIIRIGFGTRGDVIERNNEYSERLTLDSTYNRFNSGRSISINPPSRVIHVSNLKKEACNVHSLMAFFDSICRPDKVEILLNSQQKNMALVKFNTLEDSVKAICLLHNKMIWDRKVQLSFTKSKI